MQAVGLRNPCVKRTQTNCSAGWQPRIFGVRFRIVLSGQSDYPGATEPFRSDSRAVAVNPPRISSPYAKILVSLHRKNLDMCQFLLLSSMQESLYLRLCQFGLTSKVEGRTTCRRPTSVPLMGQLDTIECAN